MLTSRTSEAVARAVHKSPPGKPWSPQHHPFCFVIWNVRPSRMVHVIWRHFDPVYTIRTPRACWVKNSKRCGPHDWRTETGITTTRDPCEFRYYSSVPDRGINPMYLFLKDFGTKEELFSLVYKVKHRIVQCYQFTIFTLCFRPHPSIPQSPGIAFTYPIAHF